MRDKEDDRSARSTGFGRAGLMGYGQVRPKNKIQGRSREKRGEWTGLTWICEMEIDGLDLIQNVFMHF